MHFLTKYCYSCLTLRTLARSLSRVHTTATKKRYNRIAQLSRETVQDEVEEVRIGQREGATKFRSVFVIPNVDHCSFFTRLLEGTWNVVGSSFEMEHAIILPRRIQI